MVAMVAVNNHNQLPCVVENEAGCILRREYPCVWKLLVIYAVLFIIFVGFEYSFAITKYINSYSAKNGSSTVAKQTHWFFDLFYKLLCILFLIGTWIFYVFNIFWKYLCSLHKFTSECRFLFLACLSVWMLLLTCVLWFTHTRSIHKPFIYFLHFLLHYY